MERFRRHEAPDLAIDFYLAAVQEEVAARGYSFDRSKLGPPASVPAITATAGQLESEWQHLLCKLAVRNPALFEQWRHRQPGCHPLFALQPGPVAPWKRP